MGLVMRQIVLNVVSCKVTEHEKTCMDNQHVFVSSTFDFFDFLGPEELFLLSVMGNDNVMPPRFMIYQVVNDLVVSLFETMSPLYRVQCSSLGVDINVV